MKILLLGYSKLAKKRIINFFIKKRIKFSVASISFKKKIKGSYAQYNSYDKALHNSKADIVYISLPNSLHYYWAKKSLNLNYHVIVDKPICKNIRQAKNLIKISKKNKKLITEATFFNYHEQITKLIKLSKQEKIRNINSNFIIPYPKKGILISKKLDGGVLMDMGPYISAIPRIFSIKNIKSKKIIINKNKNGLIYCIKFLINFKKFNYSGIFKFGGDYINEIEVFLKNKSIKIERAFSPPEDENLFLLINKNNKLKKIRIIKDNCFSNYFCEVISKINKKNFSFYHKRFLDDCYFRNKILK